MPDSDDSGGSDAAFYLLDRGWSDEMAEQMAGELLAAFQTKMIHP